VEDMKRRFLILAALNIALFLQGCSLFDEACSDYYETKCDGNVLKRCGYGSGSSGYVWNTVEDCSTACPSHIAESYCGTGETGKAACICDVFPEKKCSSTSQYRCDGKSVERCENIYGYSVTAWVEISDCSESFSPTSIIESGTCSPKSSSYSIPDCGPVIRKDYRGKWKRIDQNEDYYLATNGVKGLSSGYIKVSAISPVDNNLLSITLDDDRDTSFVLVRNSITDASLSLHVKNLSPTLFKSPGMGGVGGIEVVVENINDSGDSKSKKTSNDGSAEIDDITSGDYNIIIAGMSIKQEIIDYLNAGNFYLVQDNYNYKIALSNSTPEIYSHERDDPLSGRSYNIEIEVHNIGSKDASATTISSWTDDNTIELISKDEILGTIEPGKTRKHTVTLNTTPFSSLGISKPYHDVEIFLELGDVDGNIWEDSVFIRIFEKEIPIYIYTKDISSYDNPFILVSPHREIIQTRSKNIVYVPYRPDAQYKLLAHSLSVDRETVYGIGVGAWDSEWWDEEKETFTDVSSYEPNNKESEAKTIKIGQKIISYLHKGDLDFWIIDMGK